MKTKRLIIETSASTKEALDRVLDEQGKTLTDWFFDKVEESVAPYLINSNKDRIDDLKDIEDLKYSSLILKRIEAQDWSFIEEDTEYLSHNIHPYPAKYIPQIPNRLIRMLSCKGETIWDPFGGSGTTALEALLLGRHAISSDLNPVAEIIGIAKTKSLTKDEEDEIIELLDWFKLLLYNSNSLESALIKYKSEINSYIPDIVNIEKWFHPNTIEELSFIRWVINTKVSESLKTSILSVFSKIIIRISFQDSETRYVSKLREIEKGVTLKLFKAELSNYYNKIRHLPRFLNFRKAKFITANLIEEDVVKPNSVDLIVTSPPYPNVTDYHLYHRFRLLWLGYDPKIMAVSEIGSHLRHQKENTGIESYIKEMTECLKRIYSGLRYGRFAVIILGDAVFKGEVFDTTALLSDVAISLGFERVGVVQRSLHTSKRSFANPGRRLKEEKLLILRKPIATISIKLVPPPYKLWEYEGVISQYEIKTLLTNRLIDNDPQSKNYKLNSIDVNILRRLTFTNGFEGPEYSKENTWQAILENGDASNPQTNRKDPKYVTHGIHPYKGKFYPQLAKSLINLANLKFGSAILDPFCGSGTVILESYLNGMNGIGLDINPIALKIAKVKTEVIKIDPWIVDKLVKEFITSLEKIKPNASDKDIFNQSIIYELEAWFPETILNKLGSIIKLINHCPEPIVAEFFEVCLSSLIRVISQQDPKDLRIRRRKEPITDAPVFELMIKKLIEQKERITRFAEKTKFAPSEFQKTNVFYGDSRQKSSFSDAHIDLNSIDSVITSPPYATALPYIDTDRLSILLLFGTKSKERTDIEKSLIGAREISKGEREIIDLKIQEENFANISSKTAIKIIKTVFELNSREKVGFRRKNTASLLHRYFSDMCLVLNNLNDYIKKDGNLFFVIGDNKTEAGGQSINISSSLALQEIGIGLGWKIEKVIPITVTQENRLHNKNGIVQNDIIWFKK